MKTIASTIALCTTLIASSAQGAIMTIQLGGYVSNKPTQFLDSSTVKVNDTFLFSFQFDDAEKTSHLYTDSSGSIYTLTEQPFSANLTGWTGTLSDEFAQYDSSTSGGVTGYGNNESWYRPLSTLLHSDYVFNSSGGGWILLVTHSKGNLGYGWWGIGGQGPSAWGDYTGARDYGYMSITSINIAPASTVPVPASAWLLGSGLLGLIGVMRRKVTN
ncbi:MAG: VPLPA-CTERM sorting domain-containing protein [Betaproteobacteria bacterium]|nr:VPLPA-CTERM sorting domain-containing protein [Betaproteobacteria bacterium]